MDGSLIDACNKRVEARIRNQTTTESVRFSFAVKTRTGKWFEGQAQCVVSQWSDGRDFDAPEVNVNLLDVTGDVTCCVFDAADLIRTEIERVAIDQCRGWIKS